MYGFGSSILTNLGSNFLSAEGFITLQKHEEFLNSIALGLLELYEADFKRLVGGLPYEFAARLVITSQGTTGLIFFDLISHPTRSYIQRQTCRTFCPYTLDWYW